MTTPNGSATAKTATLVKRDLPGATGVQHLYRLDPPLPDYEDDQAFEYVVVSSTDAMYSGPETYIFGADATGNITEWLELPGSFKGGMDHEAALAGAGYEVTE